MSAEPEMGQMVFGNKWEEVPAPDYVERGLYDLSERLGRMDPENQAHGLLGGSWGYGQEFDNAVFEMHPYWWGECECGFDQAEGEWSEANQHTSSCFHTRFHVEDERITALYGWDRRQDEMIAWAKKNGLAKAPYGMAVHCDCGQQEAWEAWRAVHDHEERCRVVLPNFIHKPSGLRVHWYKYIGRSTTVNRDVSFEEWDAIMDESRRTL